MEIKTTEILIHLLIFIHSFVSERTVEFTNNLINYTMVEIEKFAVFGNTDVERVQGQYTDHCCQWIMKRIMTTDISAPWPERTLGSFWRLMT